MMELPVEIQEKILKYLDRDTLFSASNVCHLWNDLTKRLFWKLSTNEIPDDCLTEITACNNIDRKLESQTWEKIYSSWYQGRCIDPTKPEITPITELQSITCFCLSGDFIIIGNDCGHVSLHDVFGRNLCLLDDEGSNVRNLVVMDVASEGPYSIPIDGIEETLHSEHDILIVVGARYVKLYRLNAVEKGGSNPFWVMDNLSNMLTATVSTYGSVFSIAATPSELSLFEVTSEDRVNVVDVLVCRSRLWKWKLWKELIICILATGEISIWHRVIEAWLSVSQRCPELFYQNPCFIYRGVVFCSSRTSQSLLEYWHCFPGDSYWLVCWDGITFHKYYPKLLMGEDVTAICLKRNIVALGTANGKLALHEHILPDNSIALIWESRPLSLIQLSQHAIRHCDISFEGRGLSVAVRTKHELMVVRWRNKPSFVH